MPRWLVTALIPVAIAIAAGIIDMRMSLARLETSLADMDRRVQHIETKLDRNELAEFSNGRSQSPRN